MKKTNYQNNKHKNVFKRLQGLVKLALACVCKRYNDERSTGSALRALGLSLFCVGRKMLQRLPVVTSSALRALGLSLFLQAEIKLHLKLGSALRALGLSLVWGGAVVVLGVATLATTLIYKSPEIALAAPNAELNFQARLMTASGQLIPDGFYNAEFKIYDDLTAGSLLWTETYYDSNGVTAGNDNRIRVENGYLTANLGSLTAFPGTIDWSEQLFLSINIGGLDQTATPTWDGEMSPRLQITAVPYAFAATVSENVRSTATNTASTNSANVSVTSGNATGTTSNSGNVIIDSGTATGTTGTITLGAANASAIQIGRASLLTEIDGSLDVAEDATFNGNLTVTAGNLFTNAGSTLFTAITISNDTDGGILGGTAAATVDIATSLNVNQTTAAQSFTLASPTVTTSGRILYINNVGSAEFTLEGNPIAAGESASYIWNGTSWVQTISFTSTGVDTVGALDGQAASANGATIVGTSIYLQSASATAVGLVNTSAQEFDGIKTFDDAIVIQGNTTSTYTAPSTVFTAGANLNFGNLTVTGAGNYDAAIYAGLTSTSNSTARLIGLFDARTSTNNTPPLSVFSPDESQAFGLGWDGQNSYGYIKSTLGVGIKSGANVLAEFGTEYTSYYRAALFQAAPDNMYVSPQGTTLNTILGIDGAVLGLGEKSLTVAIDSGSNANSQAIAVLDNRAAADNTPAIAVFTPDETDLFGLASDGSNSYGYLKSTSGIGLGIKVGTTIAAQFETTGAAQFNNTVTFNASGSTPTGGNSTDTLAILRNSGNINNYTELSLQGGNNGGAIINFGDSDDEDAGQIIYDNSTNSFAVRTNGQSSNGLRVNSSNQVVAGNGIYSGLTSSVAFLALQANFAAPTLNDSPIAIIANSNTGISDSYLDIISGNLGVAGINFGDSDDEDAGYIEYDHNTNSLLLGTNTSTALTIDSSQNTTFAGDLAVNGGDITTTQSTATLFNTNVTSANVLGAATSISLGSSTGTTSINNSLSVSGNLTIGSSNTDTILINAGVSGSGISFSDPSFDNCILTTVGGVLLCEDQQSSQTPEITFLNQAITNASTTATTPSVSPVGNVLYAYVVGAGVGSEPSFNGFSFGGTLSCTWNYVDGVSYGTRRRANLYYCTDFSGSGTVSVTHGGADSAIGIQLLDGAYINTAFGGSGIVGWVETSGSSTATQSVTITTTPSPTDITVGLIGLESQSTLTAGGAWSILGQQNEANGIRTMGSAVSSSGDTTASTWGGWAGSQGFGIAGFVVKGQTQNASKFIDKGSYTYLADTTDELVVGSSSSLGAKLAVTGGTGTTIGAIINNGTSTGDILRLQDNGTTVLSVSDGGNLAVDTNTLFVDAANNRVGIGTSSPVAGLEVTTDVTIGSNRALKWNAYYNGVSDVYLADGSAVQQWQDETNDFYRFYAAAAGLQGDPISFQEAFAIDLNTASLGDVTFDSGTIYIDASANSVSIGNSGTLTVEGLTTLNGGVTLDVVSGTTGDDLTFSDASFQNCVLTTDGAGVLTCASSGSIVTLQAAYGGGNTILATDADGDIDFTVSEATSFIVTNTGTGTSFRVNDEGSDTTPFIINADGNVGIGTASPNTKLEVVGAAASGSYIMRVQNTTNGGEIFQGVNYLGNSVIELNTAGGGAGVFILKRGNGLSNTVYLFDGGQSYFDISQGFGVGTTAPAAILEAQADIGDNLTALRVDQLDTTNNNIAVDIQNAGTGNSLQINTNQFVIASGGATSLRNATDSASAFMVATATAGSYSGASLLTVDTTNFAVELASTRYQTATNSTCGSNCTITQLNVDTNAAIIVEATAEGLDITLPDPTDTTAGRLVYITAANGSEDFTLIANAGGGLGVEQQIAMRQNTTATMIWDGTNWTAAGASSSTTLQAAYDNTLTAAGGAEIILNNTASSNGLTVRNNAATPIIGEIFEAQTSIGSNLFSVNNNAIEYATNGGAETQGASPSTFPASTWGATPDGGTVTRYTTIGDYVATGQGSVSVVTAATANQGASNTLDAALTPNLRYSVSFAVRGTTGFNTLDVVYSPDGTNTGTVACATGETVTQGAWTRVTCFFDAPASGITSSNAILIRQSDATARTFYVENLSVTVKADVNHAIDGSVDDAGNFSTYWTAAPGGGTVSRDTSIIYDTSGSAQVTTTATVGHGIRNNMAITPTVDTQYLVTFYARSSNTFDDIRVRYSRDGGSNFVSCVDYNTQSVSTSSWTRITCLFTTDSTTATNADLIIDQPTGVARDFYVDALSITLNTNTASNVKIGGGSLGGPTTLLTLDRSAGPPVAANNDAYLGSMYYDTLTGRIQCYEAGGWGTCGAPPDNIVNLNPEYAGAVLNGTGIGTMQADVCANETGILQVNSSLCGTGEARNYYQWTSPQATQQTYSIFVTYQLPSTFDGFANDDTVQITGRVDSTTNAAVTYEMFRSQDGAISQCGSGETNVATTANTWQTVGINGNEATGCGFTSASANAFVLFKINLKANSNAYAYVSTLTFTTTGR